jgi:transcriptional regulator with XRE-family HTH domain
MGNRLRELRKQKGVGFVELAARAKVSTQTVAIAEKYDHVPSKERQERLAAVLGVGISDIWPEQEGR